jgi:hypothetical protein
LGTLWAGYTTSATICSGLSASKYKRERERLNEQEGRLVPVVWENVDGVPVLLANQFIIQHFQDEFILTMGQMVPPTLLGAEEQREAQLRAIERVTVRPLARIAFTRARLTELIETLAAHRERYDREQQERDEQFGGGL